MIRQKLGATAEQSFSRFFFFGPLFCVPIESFPFSFFHCPILFSWVTRIVDFLQKIEKKRKRKKKKEKKKEREKKRKRKKRKRKKRKRKKRKRKKRKRKLRKN